MKKIILILLAILFLMTFKTNAQVIVFRTYEDYKNNSGVKYDDLHSFSHTFGKVKLTLRKNKDKVKIACKNIWGFKYKEAFFRIGIYNQPALVVSIGSVVYYENGYAHLGILLGKKDKGEVSIGYFYYLSKNINSEIYSPGQLNQFITKYPECKVLIDCIKVNYRYQSNYEKARICVEDFE